jgi:hypothetical protein|tara:strand:+ start:609 stop:845 length:237 start_codon:yes stop_codon:yes gene_type:complete
MKDYIPGINAISNAVKLAMFKAGITHNPEIDKALNQALAEGKIVALHNGKEIDRVEHSRLITADQLRDDISYKTIHGG